MPTQLFGYEDDAAAKSSALQEITSTKQGNKALLDVAVGNQLISEKWDYLVTTYPTTTSEVYTFKTGGASGTTVAVVTIVYTDATKENISTVTKV